MAGGGDDPAALKSITSHRLLLGGVLSATSGLMDGLAFLGFNAVFVSNMTGNTILAGLGVARVPAIWLAGLLSALAGFVVGTAIATRVFARGGRTTSTSRLLTAGLSIEAVLLVLIALAIQVGHTDANAVGAMIIALMSVTMGTQGVIAKMLKVPAVSTLAVTSTLQRLAQSGTLRGLRVNLGAIVSICAIVVGAAVSGLLIVHASATIAPIIAAVLAAGSAIFVSRSPSFNSNY